MKVIRKTLNANEAIIFDFDVYAHKILVKNLTEGDILVCLGNTFNENEAVKIPSMAFEVLEDNFNTEIVSSQTYSTDFYNKIIVKAVEGGEVEVRCLK